MISRATGEREEAHQPASQTQSVMSLRFPLFLFLSMLEGAGLWAPHDWTLLMAFTSKGGKGRGHCMHTINCCCTREGVEREAGEVGENTGAEGCGRGWGGAVCWDVLGLKGS